MSKEPHTCPRRAETGMDDPHSPLVGSGTNLDTWRDGTPENAGPSCSYCGSLNADQFMELIREGCAVVPTDKNYKAYVQRPFTDTEQAERKADWLTRFTDLSEEAHAEMSAHWDREYGAGGRTVGKFYFQHLTPEQRTEFVELHNARQMKIGVPGYFYTPPFFTGPAAE